MTLRRLGLTVAIAAIASPALALVAFRLEPSRDPLMMYAGAHFWLVGTAVAAAVAACIVIAASRTLRETSPNCAASAASSSTRTASMR